MRKLFYNISSLYGTEETPVPFRSGLEMSEVKRIHNAWILVKGTDIEAFGTGELPECEHKVDLQGYEVMPGFVDSHTHAVFADERTDEFVLRIKGAGYEEIAAAGGGILNSSKKLRLMPEEDLYIKALNNVGKLIYHGTTTLEIKSGYGLDLDSEIKMLRVIARLRKQLPVTIKSTFLGAHAVPNEYKGNKDGYVKYLLEEMLPEVVRQGLADHVDVFCDRGFFSVEDTELILKTAEKVGLPGKIHANELGLTGGVQVAVKCNAWSADHLEHCGPDEIESLRNSQTMPVGLPGTSYFLGIPYAPGRTIIDSGLPFCLASDFNPGSSPVASLQMIWSLACSQMKLLPEEAFNAITINAARALRLENSCGSIAVGKRADFITLKVPNSLYTIPYYFGQNHVASVYAAGQKVEI